VGNKEKSVRHDSKSAPRSTFDGLRLAWTRPDWCKWSRLAATSSAIFKQDVQWRGFPFPDGFDPT
jgi:hypothetical protein